MICLLYGRVLYSTLHAYLIAKRFFTTLQGEVKYLSAFSHSFAQWQPLTNLSGGGGVQGLHLDSPLLHNSFLVA